MKQIINKGLYKEGLKQTALVAVIYFCIVELIGAVVAFSNVSYAANQELNNGSVEKMLIDGIDFNPLYMLSFALFVPLMGLVAFHFLNARNKSDFYHSLPHKRKTIFVSYTLSIITWLVVILAITSLTSFCIYFLNARYFSIGFQSIFTYIFTIFSASILVLGAGLLAVSITGTIFTNIITASLVLFLPRTIMTLFVMTVQRNAPVLSNGGLGLISDSGYNLVFGFAASILGISSGDIFTEVNYGIYSLILGVIYIIIGGILFSLRKSETAGSPALSKKVHAIIRISLSFFVSVIATTVLFNNTESTVTIIALYLISLVVYFSYEIITKKTFKTIPKTVPALGILAALNVVFALAVVGVSSTLLNVNWEVDRIDSISISYQEDMYQSPSYEDYLMDDTTIKNPEVLNLVSELLTQNQEAAKIEENNFYIYNSFNHIIVRMKNGKTYHRSLYLSDEDYLRFQQAILKSEVKESVFSEIPEEVGSISINSMTQNFTEEDTNNIYNTFKEEVTGLSTDQWASYLITNGTLSSTLPYVKAMEMAEDTTQTITYSSQNLPSISLSGYYGVKKYQSIYTISPDLTPKTFSLICELGNTNSKEEFLSYWNAYQENGIQYLDYDQVPDSEGGLSVYGINFSGYNPDTNAIFDEYYNNSNALGSSFDQMEPILTALDKALQNNITTVDYSKPVVYVTIDAEKYVVRNNDIYITNSERLCYIVNLDPKDFPQSKYQG
ncbi:hypothetical protein [Scatolibacter rhodanostii]|uniref:hypothetical protein n=1 Tax=Scatolibacter rhodanostii TaxID=2014781 RepID=UPI000C08603F|nr:hypothetical protein [Scatolibacter rhodanostii]